VNRLPALLAVAVAFAAAGETGKIAGRVTDKATGQSLPQVSVVISGTAMGTATDNSGRYVILAVPVGTCTLEVSMIGYRPVKATDVRVEGDRTTRLDFRLEPAAISMPGITVKAERPMVSKEVVAARYAVQARDISVLPADYVEQMVKFSPGVAQTESSFHVRGGRASEVDYLIDGVSVVDPLTGEFGINVPKGVADEVIFLPGGFSAEYGRAMSGVVNLVTVNPGRKFAADYTAKSEKPMPYYYDFGYTDQAVKVHLPLFPGLRAAAVANVLTTDDWDPRLFRLPHKGRADYSMYAKVLYDLGARLRFSVSGVAARTQFERYKSDWRLILNNYRSDLRQGNLVIGTATWSPSARSYFSATLARFHTDKTYGVKEPGAVSAWQDFAFEDTSRYSTPAIGIENPWGMRWPRWFYFYTRGTYEDTRRSVTDDLSVKLACNSQVAAAHQLSAGLAGDFYDVRTDWIRWPAWHAAIDTYRFQPTLFAVYVRDKVEYEGLYADLGLRYDRFSPNGRYPDTTQPTSFDYEDTSAARSQVSPRLGASFRITQWLFARANFGYYFQVPQFAMLFDNALHPVRYRTELGDTGQLVVGNPELKPERTQSYEVGLQGELTKELALTANLWSKDVRDLVGTVKMPWLPYGYVTYVNTEFAKLTGLELIADVRTAWLATRVSYTLSFARGTSSSANEDYYEFLRRGDTAPAVEHTLDFEQRHRAFVQVDLKPPENPTKAKWLNSVMSDVQLRLLGYVGTGYPYSPPGGKGDPATWNTRLGPVRSNVDAVVTKGLRFGPVKVDLVAEVLNLLDIRDVMYVYPATGRPDDDGEVVDYFDPTFQMRPDTVATWWGCSQYRPAADANHDGYITNYEEYRSAYLYHKAAIDWVNNYGPPRRARLGFTISF
jgi:outer membrane receptor protein involved in Fe transport